MHVAMFAPSDPGATADVHAKHTALIALIYPSSALLARYNAMVVAAHQLDCYVKYCASVVADAASVAFS